MKQQNLGRLLFVRLREYEHNLKEGQFDEAKLALHDFEERQKINWTQAFFYNLSPKQLAVNINEMLTLYITTILLVSQVCFLLIRKELKCD